MSMTAKDELRCIYVIQRRIERLKQRKEALEVNMLGVRSPAGSLSPDKVQVSLSGDKLLDAIAEIDELEMKIVSEIKRLEQTKMEIISRIESLDDERYRTVLYYRYVAYWKWEEIAVYMHCAVRHIYRLHGEALKQYALIERCH